MPGGMGLSILDNLDTLWLMGLDEEYERARSFVHLNLSFNIDAEVNTFETTIRALAGAPASASALHPLPLCLRTCHCTHLRTRTHTYTYTYTCTRTRTRQACCLPTRSRATISS